jgi:hypothetical protein
MTYSASQVRGVGVDPRPRGCAPAGGRGAPAGPSLQSGPPNRPHPPSALLPPLPPTSQVVLEVLLRAHAEGRRFRVVIVDSRPECGGRQLLRRLLDADVACTYTLLSGLSYAIKEVGGPGPCPLCFPRSLGVPSSAVAPGTDCGRPTCPARRPFPLARF